jgi:molybdate transport system substrate-binding protein
MSRPAPSATPATGTPAAPLSGLSSMATRALLADLAADWVAAGGAPLAIESIGGVDAARRVESGEALDLVFLASDALAKLEAGGHLVADSTRALVRSDVAVAVKAGAPCPDIATEPALREVVLAAPSIGYSTGPSGTQLLKLFERWGIAEALRGRLVQAPPGVPVGTLVARGQVALGFQQRSELVHLPGLSLLGPMPPEAAIVTVFAGAVARTSRRVDDAAAVLAHWASPATAERKRQHGMAPA